MSLRQAVEMIAGAMEQTKSLFSVEKDKTFVVVLDSYIVQLKTALKASESEISTPPAQEDSKSLHRDLINREKEKLRKAREMEEVEESFEPRFVEVVNGPGQGDIVTVDFYMKIGDTIVSNGHTYQLRADGKLHHLFLG